MTAAAGAFNSQQLIIPAGQAINYSFAGAWFEVLYANSNTFKIGLDQQPPQTCFAGLKIETEQGSQFSSVTVDNTAGTATLLLIAAWGTGKFTDARPVQAQSQTVQGSSAFISPNPGAGVNALVAGDMNTIEVIVSNPLTNPREIWIGADNTVAVNNGVEVLPGEKVTFRTGAKLWVYNPHTASMPVAGAVLKR